MRLTVGPLPPAVYWRRRVFVLAAVLLTLFLVAQACMAAAVDSEAGRESPSSPGPPSAVAAASPDPASPPADPSGEPAGSVGEPAGDPAVPADEEQIPDGDQCTDAEMLITAETSATTAPAGSVIRLTIRIQNGSDRVCRRDVGPGQREIYLRRGSGADRVWSSRDCVELSGSEELDLLPTYNTTHFVDWNGRGSDSCDGPQPAGEQLGPGEYELVARLGTVYSEPVTITLT